MTRGSVGASVSVGILGGVCVELVGIVGGCAWGLCVFEELEVGWCCWERDVGKSVLGGVPVL